MTSEKKRASTSLSPHLCLIEQLSSVLVERSRNQLLIAFPQFPPKSLHSPHPKLQFHPKFPAVLVAAILQLYLDSSLIDRTSPDPHQQYPPAKTFLFLQTLYFAPTGSNKPAISLDAKLRLKEGT